MASRYGSAVLALLVGAALVNGEAAYSSENSQIRVQLDRLAVKAGGRLGLAARNLDSGGEYLYHGDEYFPMQSVYKLPIAIAVLKHVDQGKWTLDQKFVLASQDLSALYSPLADRLSRGKAPYSLSLRTLLEAMIEESDNTACDYFLSLCGGPASVTATLRELGIEGLSVDRPESAIQPEIFGLPPLTAVAPLKERRLAWEEARRKASAGKSFNKYLEDRKRDTSTPAAMVQLMARLYRGELLSGTNTAYLIQVLTATKTGAGRLKAALPASASIAHKTGTGPDLGALNSATNDVGIITNGDHLAIAVFLAGSSLPLAKREAIIADACRIILRRKL